MSKNGPQRFRKRPVIIGAMQLRWDTWSEMCKFAGVGNGPDKPRGIQLEDGKIGLMIPTLEGTMLGTDGDWIIRGTHGELYPCKPEIFEETYVLVEPDAHPITGLHARFDVSDVPTPPSSPRAKAKVSP